MIAIRAQAVRRPLKTTFAIARGAKTAADCLVVEIENGGFIGRGEAVPYARYGETMEGALGAIHCLSIHDIQIDTQALPIMGAARNAVDCALWDLHAKMVGKAVWELLGVPAPLPVRTAQTLSLDTPEAMSRAASALSEDALIKIKLGGADDIARLEAIRASRPDGELIIDANEGWSVADYEELLPTLQRLKIAMIEQPFPANADDALETLPRPIPICADESAHFAEDIPFLRTRYDMVNIKLDKTGGLGAALEMANAAIAAKLPYMIGCMVASSLSMAPAMLLAHQARYVDLDGPLFIAEDVPNGIVYKKGIMYPFAKELWG